MRTFLDCFSCFMDHGLGIARRNGLDESQQREVLNRVAEMLPGFPSDASPPQMSLQINRMIREITGESDPFAGEKQQSNRMALEAAPEVRRLIARSAQPLRTAVEFAIAGNSIDLGVSTDLDITHTMQQLVADEESRIGAEAPENFALPALKADLAGADTLLFIADNAGEIVFDMLLIEQLRADFPQLKMSVAVRHAPIINDATLEDAEAIGLTELVPVISSGSEAPGTILSMCSAEFTRLFDSADVVISKGQGNYETLSEVDRGLYFLFKTKCKVIARHSGSEVGDIMLVCKAG
ncbi:MAG: ARMT1-like domain-containing protein [Spirochaetia bacterium]|nr:ARMT1-like domain-containing protein [Spirochaetia bacterium]